jgi:hypothetical protein
MLVEEFMAEGWGIGAHAGGVRMKHNATRFLYAYWDRLRDGRPAPQRREIEPASIGRILSSTFILEASDDGRYPYRLAGTHICSLFGRELKAADWLAHWLPDDRSGLAGLMRGVVDDALGAVILFQGFNARHQTVPLETLLLPLVHRETGFRRILGATAALDTPYWLGAHPVVEISLNSVSLLAPRCGESPDPAAEPEPPTADPSLPVRREGHLAVYDGGRADRRGGKSEQPRQ